MERFPLIYSMNALSLSPDRSLIVCGGREILKILKMSDLTQVRNLRIAKSNSNSSTQDLAWHYTQSELILSAAKNSCIVLWNLNKSGSDKMETVYKGHSKVVNRVEWHPNQEDIFISAAQDGNLRVWDRRESGESVKTLLGSPEGARDVTFSKHKDYLVGASFDNGFLKVWDLRTENQVFNTSAHSKSALSIDWHPHRPDCIASGGMDKCIKIWNLEGKEPLNKIQAPEPVGRVKWHPTRNEMIASFSDAYDNNLYVWDIEKPFLPEFIYRGHSQPIKDFHWINDSTQVISCSDDTYIIRQPLDKAYSPKSDRPKNIHALSSLNLVASVQRQGNSDRLTFASLGDPKSEIKNIAEKCVLKGDIENVCKANAEVSEKTAGVWKAIGMLTKLDSEVSNSWFHQIIEESFAETIEFHAENGDLQTSACISNVLNAKGPINEYSEMLRQLELTKLAAKLPISHRETEFFLACKCGNSTEESECKKCVKFADCSVCGHIVKGLYTWCQVCGHGGHSSHISGWFKTNSLCPTGCGHTCQNLGPVRN